MSAQPDGSGSQTGAAKLGNQVRERSPFMFLVIGLCFFLPFVSISCSGQDIATMSGVQLVTGAEVEIDPAFTEQLEELGAESDEGVPTETEENDPSILAIVALAAALLGVVVGFALKGRTRAVASLAAAVVGLVGLIGLRFDLNGDVSEGEGLVSIKYKIGYWLVALLFLGLAIAHGMFVRGARQTGPPSTGPPGPGP